MRQSGLFIPKSRPTPMSILRSSPRITGNDRRLPKAIKDMDILLAAHEGDLSFYMDDLLKKAELLAHSGDPQVLYIALSYVYTGEKTR